MGMSFLDMKRATQDRERIFAVLRNQREFIKGLREREPLPDGVKDEA